MPDYNSKRQSNFTMRARTLASYACATLATLAPIVLPMPAYAAWDTVPSITIETGHNSNLRLSPENTDSAIQSTAVASLSARYYDNVSSLRAQVSASYSDYKGASDTVQDTDRQKLSLLYSRRTERVAFGGSVGYRKDDMLRRQFTLPAAELPLDSSDPNADPIDNLAPDDPAAPDPVDDGFDTDLNRTDSQLTRRNLSLSAFTQLRLDTRNRLRLTYRFNNRDLSQSGNTQPDTGSSIDGTGDETVAVNSPTRDTKRHALQLQWARDLSERSKLLTEIESSNVATQGRDDVSYYNANFIWRSKMSPVWRLDASTGISVLDSEEGDQGTDIGWLVGILSSHQFANGKLVAEVRRALQPSIFGGVEESDRARLSYSQSIGPKLGASLGVSGIRSRRERRSGDINQNTLTLSPSLHWRFHPALEASAIYEYRWTDRGGQSNSFTPGKAKAHIGLLSIRYFPTGIGSKR